jgi:hypothetical protein
MDQDPCWISLRKLSFVGSVDQAYDIEYELGHHHLLYDHHHRIVLTDIQTGSTSPTYSSLTSASGCKSLVSLP